MAMGSGNGQSRCADGQMARPGCCKDLDAMEKRLQKTGCLDREIRS